MADNSSKSRNAEFLRKLDQQHALKKCTRIIDLRGKVPGECRKYEFGGLSHYLDDRAYLLAKRLLERFNGQYTMGVYETLLKALKTLKSEAETAAKANYEEKPILTREAGKAQAIGFHTIINRQEPRINHITELQLQVNDVVYSANTIDISTSSLKVTLKRVFTLVVGASVNVTFKEFSELDDGNILIDVPYKILKIEHDELRSYVVLIRNRSSSDAITEWLDNWSEKNNSIDKRDLNNELLNIASSYYLRLYGIVMNSPLFWLSEEDNEVKVKLFNSTPATQSLLLPLLNKEHSIDFSLMPFNKIARSGYKDYFMVTYHENDTIKSIVTPTTNAKAIRDSLAYFNETSHLFLLEVRDVTMDLGELEASLEQLNHVSKESCATLTEQLKLISHLVSMSDITQCLAKFRLKSSTITKPDNADIKQPKWLGTIPKPIPIQPYIPPQQHRFLIRTTVKATLPDGEIETITRDVSEQGMSLRFDSHMEIQVGTTIFVNFVSWQKQTTAISLKKIPYIVRNVQLWQGQTRVGLQRNSQACKSSINQFFISIIERNKEQLAIDIDREFLSQRSKVLNKQLGLSTKSIPLFWGMDENNKRILQAFSVNKHTQLDHPELWKALQTLTAKLTEKLKTEADQNSPIISLGIYCYEAADGVWHVISDNEFENIAQKSLYLSRAMQAQHYYFFSCSLSSIHSSLIDNQVDLKNQLLQLRSHSSHKVKVIREVLYSLFAIGELTDITTIIKAVYENQNRH